MNATDAYRPLTDEEIQSLIQRGCDSDDWSAVQVSDGFTAERVARCHFAGAVRIGDNRGTVVGPGGVTKMCGMVDAHISNCTIGNDVRIARVAVHLANYDIEDGVCIEGVGLMETRPEATFGNGVEIEPVNEGGGREVILFDNLDCQFANLICLHRYRTGVIEHLLRISRDEANRVRSDRGRVGVGAMVRNVTEIVDVRIGAAASVVGAASLCNGTILSSLDAPTTIGVGVDAEDFIVAEGSELTGGAIVSKTYIGQGCQVGRHFSAEGSLFFANSEALHGEACSIFAGPYTVTHHKSTLLIAALFSFYNAGSGTNQSNHMYKLGPIHEGKLERGCKTGSFSYMMWPCHVGPFNVVLGKHTRTFDTADFPFSLLDATPEGRCHMIPGLTLATVGTVRDGAKWPARDCRKGPLKRDRITFDVFSPYTVGRMMRGSARLKELQDTTARDVDTVAVSGTEVRRVLLRTGLKFYRSGIQMYLLDKVVQHVERAIQAGAESLSQALASPPAAVFSEEWIDLGGQLMPRARLDTLCQAIESGEISDIAAMQDELDRVLAAYADDEWVWVKWAYRQVFDVDVDAAGADEIQQAADSLRDVRGKFLKQILNDARREFDEMTQTGFGHHGTAEDADADFLAVRGDYDSNKFVKQMTDEIEALVQRVDRFQRAVAGLAK